MQYVAPLMNAAHNFEVYLVFVCLLAVFRFPKIATL